MKQTWKNTYEAPVAEELMIKVETNLLESTTCPSYVPIGGGEGGVEDDWG